MKNIHFCITLDVGMSEEEIRKCGELLEETFREYLVNHVHNGDHIYSTAGKTLFRHVVKEITESNDYDWHENWGEMED